MQMQPISPQGMLPVSADNQKSNETKDSMDSLLAFFSSENSLPDKESPIESKEEEKLSTDKETQIQTQMDYQQNTEKSKFVGDTSALTQAEQALGAQFHTKDVINFVDEHLNLTPLVTNLVDEIEQHISEGVRKFMADDAPQVLKKDILQFLADKALVDLEPKGVDHTITEMKSNDLLFSGDKNIGETGIAENIVEVGRTAEPDFLFTQNQTAEMLKQPHVPQNLISEATISLKDMDPTIRWEVSGSQQKTESQIIPDQMLGLVSDDSETIQLTAQSKTFPSSNQPGGLPVPVVEDEISAAVQQLNSSSRSEDPIPGRSENPVAGSTKATQMKTETRVSDTVDPQFADLLMKPAKLQSEKLPDIVPLKLRDSNSNGDNNRNTYIAGQEARNQKISFSLADASSSESNLDSSGNNHHSAKPNSNSSFSINMTTAETGEIGTTGAALSQSTIPQSINNNQDPATIRLPSGTLIAENKIVDHVIKQMSIRTHNGVSSITIKMHPEELGHLKMDLTVDKDVVKAHIQTQSVQVQEVLEKYISRLRDGFDQQGLKLEHIQVSIDSDRNTDPGLFQDRHNPQANLAASNSLRMDDKVETISEEAITKSAALENGISLRV